MMRLPEASTRERPMSLAAFRPRTLVHCKAPADAKRAEDEKAWSDMVTPWKAARPSRLQQAVGCLECRMTGYLGRIGLYEIMPMTIELKAMISAHTDLAALRERAIKAGMHPLRIAGARKVAAGMTTIEEVLKVAPPLQDMVPTQ